MTSEQKDRVTKASGFLGFATFALFAAIVYFSHAPQNIVTWALVFALDALGLILVFKGGNKEPLLQLGWTVAAFFMLVAVLFNGSQFSLGWIEIICILLCCGAVILQLVLKKREKKREKVALYVCMIASGISFLPQMFDYWQRPQPEMFWMWILFMTPCILAIIGAERKDFIHTFVPWCAIGLDAVLAILCVL